MKGLLIAAPSSGAGKTTITLGLLRALSRKGCDIASAKSGPDYIDPQFHSAATGRACVTLDAWAMSDARLLSLAAAQSGEYLIVEGAMGLFDGAPPDGSGSSADLAAALVVPIILVVDCARQSYSVAALVSGFIHHRTDLQIAGLILNNTGSERHDTMLKTALDPLGIPVFGCIRRAPNITHPSRHLGLQQAQERADLAAYLDCVADHIETSVDLDRILSVATAIQPPQKATGFQPLGQNIAIAQDQAFRFAYPHMLADWRAAGATLSFFSPLADQPPAPHADAIFLPGGYPELHAGQLSQAANFKQAMQTSNALIYGECGGYMALGAGLIDADNMRHEMLGLLDLETSFASPKRHLGYRNVTALSGPLKGSFKAHEFHYSSALTERGTPLFQSFDAQSTPLGQTGLTKGRVFGSYSHLITPAV